MANGKIRVLVMRPGQVEEEAWITPAHDVLRNIVGGDIDMKNPMDDGTVIICGKADGERVPNRVLMNSRGQVVARFYGTIIVSGVFLKEGELDSLTDSEIQRAKSRLKKYGMRPPGRGL